MSRSLILKNGRSVTCPRCGRPTNVLVGGVCPDCYREEHRLVELPSELVLEVCKICGAVRISGGAWSREDQSKIIEEAVRGKMRILGDVSESMISVGDDLVIVKVRGKVHEALPKEYWEEYTIPIRRRYTICPACIKVLSKKEEARIQIRALGRDLSVLERRTVRETVEKSLGESWVRGLAAQPIKFEEDDKGIDIVLASREAARKLVAALAGKMFFDVLETSKDIGIDESGRGKRRITYRLLLPPFGEGDVVEYRGKILLLEKVYRGRLAVKDLESMDRGYVSLSKRLYKEMRVLSRVNELEEGMVVSVEPPYVMVMSLSDYNSFEVRLKGGFGVLSEGSRVKIFRHGDKIHIIPL